mgnify:CR=1 FL=1
MLWTAGVFLENKWRIDDSSGLVKCNIDYVFRGILKAVKIMNA